MSQYFIQRRRIALFFLFFAALIAMMISVKIWINPPVRQSVPLRTGLIDRLAPADFDRKHISPEMPAVFPLTDH